MCLWPQSVRQPFGKAGFGRIPTTCGVLCHDLLSKSSAGSQSRFDLSDQGIVDDHARFEVQRLDLKNTLLAMGLGIDATDQRIVVQDRQGEVAIFAPGCTLCWAAYLLKLTGVM